MSEASELKAPKRQYMKYPWDRWLNGESHTLIQGVDFATKASILRNQIYSKLAKNPDNQVKVELTSEGNLVVQVVPRTRVLKNTDVVSEGEVSNDDSN